MNQYPMPIYLSVLLCSTFCTNMLAQKDVAYEMVVSPDGTGGFIRIQDAVDATKAFPAKRTESLSKTEFIAKKEIHMRL